jgi:hypothetical protein
MYVCLTQVLLAAAPDLSLTTPATPDSTETLAAFAREIQVSQCPVSSF